jgi:AcrR family transcriptional regulator
MHKPPRTKKRKTTPRTRRRRLKPAARRSELLDAALSVLRSQSPDRVRVEDVTRAAGAAKGTFYLYFPSWNDLLVAVRHHILSTYGAEVGTRMAAATPSEWWRMTESECVRFVDFILELGDLHQAIFHGPVSDQPIDPESSAEALIARLLSAGVAVGACRPVDTDAAASLLFSVLHTTADGIARSGSREQRIESMLDLLRAWLRAPAGEGGAVDATMAQRQTQ